MSAYTVLLLPGWQNSGPDHWQSRWEAAHGYLRVEQHDWLRPLRGDWVARLQEVVLAQQLGSGPAFSQDRPQPWLRQAPRGGARKLGSGPAFSCERSDEADIVLVAHSLGCLLVAAWAATSPSTTRIKAALLVAPGDPQRDELAGALSSWIPVTRQKLPFPSVMLGSHNDPYCDIGRARGFAESWGSQFVDYGDAGHINAESGLGLWPAGHAWLERLCQTKK